MGQLHTGQKTKTMLHQDAFRGLFLEYVFQSNTSRSTVQHHYQGGDNSEIAMLYEQGGILEERPNYVPDLRLDLELSYGRLTTDRVSNTAVRTCDYDGKLQHYGIDVEFLGYLSPTFEKLGLTARQEFDIARQFSSAISAKHIPQQSTN